MLNIESFFKDKIDWKFYNYLIDRFTDYEDLGYVMLIDISVTLNSDDQLIYNSDKRYCSYSLSYMNLVIKSYNTHGLFYNCYIYDKTDYHFADRKIAQLFKDKIENKCKYLKGSEYIIYCQPK